MSVTIKDIAQVVGVSYSTVAKALNNSPVVREDTKRRIWLVAKQLGYQPNLAAKSLVSKKSKVIGVVWPSVERAALSSLVTHIKDELATRGYDALISIHTLPEAIALFEQMQVHGIIVFEDRTVPFSHPAETIRSQLPLICIGEQASVQAPCISVNRKQAIQLAVNQLADKGRTRLMYMGDLSHPSSLQQEKYIGFLEGVVGRHLPTHPQFTIDTKGLTWQDGYKAAKIMLQSDYKPDGIIIGSYELTAGALRAIQESNLRIPEDLSIIGYDNIKHMDHLEIPISAVGVPLEDQACHIAEALLQLMDDPEQIPPLTVLSATYVERGS